MHKANLWNFLKKRSNEIRIRRELPVQGVQGQTFMFQFTLRDIEICKLDLV